MLIIGCGVIGRQLGASCTTHGEQVRGLVRTEHSAEMARGKGIDAAAVDLDSVEHLPYPTAGEQVFYLAPPPDEGTADTRMGRVIRAFAQGGQPRRILYISTTGVYGDCGGAWIDEEREVNPQSDRARRRLDSEHQLSDWSGRTGGEVVILRVAGIYGPGKLPLERLRQRLPVVREEEASFTNRIHSEDLVQACLAAMERGRSGRVYHVCDGHPSTMTDYFRRLADAAGLPHPPEISLAEAEEHLSPGMLSYMRESRRLSNRRLREELGVKLKYPSLESGLPACFA